MPSRASATRYARALFDVALKESDPVQIGRDLASFADLMSSNAELHGALTNPAVPAAAKHQIADTLATRLSILAPAHKLLLLVPIADIAADGHRVVFATEFLHQALQPVLGASPEHQAIAAPRGLAGGCGANAAGGASDQKDRIVGHSRRFTRGGSRTSRPPAR